MHTLLKSVKREFDKEATTEKRQKKKNEVDYEITQPLAHTRGNILMLFINLQHVKGID